MKTVASLSGFLLVACCALGVQANEESTVPEDSAESSSDAQELGDLFDVINPIVTTATKDARRLEQAPSIMLVLTRADLQNWGYTTLAEALRHQLGFYVVDDHVLPNVSVRGVGAGLQGQSSVIKVLINGAPVSFRGTGGNWLGAELIPISLIDHVEIIRGPASALYGADAFLGVVNIVTRDDTQDTVDASLAAEHVFSNRDVGVDPDVSLVARTGRLTTTLSVRQQTENRGGLRLPASSPAPALPDYAPGRTVGGSALRTSRVGMARLRYMFTPDTELAVTGYISEIERIDEYAGLQQLLGGSDGQGRPSFNQVAEYSGYAGLQLHTRLSDSVNLTLLGTYFFGSTLNFGRTEVGSDAYYVRRRQGFGGADASLEARWQPMMPLVITGGLGFIYDQEAKLNNDFVAKQPGPGYAAGALRPDLSTHQGTQQLLNPSVYAQALWTVHPTYLTVTAGARYDYHNIYKSQPSWRLGLVSEVTPRTYVKVLYGSAFKAPTPLLLYTLPAHTGDIIGNPFLLPQRINTVEAEVTQRISRNLTLSTGVAYNMLDDKAEFVAVGNYQVAATVGQIQSISWESRARFVMPEDFEAYGSFELLGVRRTNHAGAAFTSAENPIYPTTQAHLGLQKWLPAAHLRGVVDVSFAARRRGTDQNVRLHGAAYYAPAYAEVNFGISSVDLMFLEDRPTEIGVFARNLFNQGAADPGFNGVDYPRLPTTVMLTLRQQM